MFNLVAYPFRNGKTDKARGGVVMNSTPLTAKECHTMLRKFTRYPNRIILLELAAKTV